MTKRLPIAILSILLALSAAGPALCGPDNNAMGAGATQTHNFKNLTLCGAFGNPALAGLDALPKNGLSLMPTSIALWSDKFAPPFNRYVLINPFNVRRSLAFYFTSFFEESFGVSELSTPEEVSELLTRQLGGGIGVYAGAQTAPFAFATRGFGLTARSYADLELRIPEGLLLPFFSGTDGLLAGNTLDISDLSVSGIWASEIAVKLGFSTVIPALRDYLKLDRGAAGAGMKLILGHSYLKMDADKNASLAYDSAANRYRADATVDIVTVGTGIHGDFYYDSDLLWGHLISGQGWGLDLGAVFHNKRHLVSIDVQDIGMIFWDGRQVHKGSFALNREFDLPDLARSMSDLFGLDTLVHTNRYMLTLLPTALNAGYTCHLDLSKYEATDFLLGYLSASAGYRQQLVLGPGRNTYSPRLTVGGSLGLLSGYLPVRYGLIFGGPEDRASVLGLGLDLGGASFDASYKTIGSPLLRAEKGFEAAAALTVRWGWNKERKWTRARQKEPEPVQQAPIPETAPETPPLPELEEFPAEDDFIIYEPVEIVLTMLPPEPSPTIEEAERLNTSQRAINFRTGGAELAPGSGAALDEIAVMLRQYPHIRYEIQGHTDSQGGDRFNLLLSAERAASVKKALTARGAPEESLIAIGYGKSAPIADNNTAIGRALNRRVEFAQILSQEQYDALKKVELELIKNLSR